MRGSAGATRWLLRAFFCLCLLLPAAAFSQQAAPSDAYAQLADLLQDDAARQRLIDELRQLAGEAVQEASPAAADSAADADRGLFSVPRRLANWSQRLVEDVVNEIRDGAEAVRTLDLAALDWRDIGRAIVGLAFVMLTTIGAFLVLRFAAARPWNDRARHWAARDGAMPPILRRTLAVALVLVLNVLVVVLAGLAGSTLAWALAGGGEPRPIYSLFLYAFLLTEIVKAVLRMFLSPRSEALRLLPLDNEEAVYWNSRAELLAGFVGYGLLFVAPAIGEYLSDGLGRIVELLILLAALVWVLRVVAHNRRRVSAAFERIARESDFLLIRALAGVLARAWHWLVVAFSGVLIAVTILHPEDALPVLTRVTLQTAATILIGAFLLVLIQQLLSRRIRLAPDTRARYPALENTLNSYIPAGLKFIRAIVVVTIVAVIAHSWGLVDLGQWWASDRGVRVVGTVVSVGLIFLVAAATWIGVSTWIEHRLSPRDGRQQMSSREKTLLSIFRNVIAIALVVITLMMALAELGLNIAPLIAGAGVIGLAIGFGAQRLVQDVITGVFIQLENAINTGESVTVAGVTGTVEKLTIRSLSLRDGSGTYHVVPFSSVTTVANLVRGYGFFVGDYRVAYKEDIERVYSCLRDAFDELRSNPDFERNIVADLEISGVTALTESAVNVRVRIKARPGRAGGIGNQYNWLVKQHFERAGIEIPFPHMRVYFGEDPDGVPIRAAGAPSRASSKPRRGGRSLPAAKVSAGKRVAGEAPADLDDAEASYDPEDAEASYDPEDGEASDDREGGEASDQKEGAS